MSVTHRRLPPRIFMRDVSDHEILTLWRIGKDTYDIATVLDVPEYEIERRLHLAKDRERRDQEWNWPPEQRPQP